MIASQLFAQPDIIWHRFYGDEGYQSFYASVKMENNNLACVGVSDGGVYFVRTNEGGEILMENVYEHEEDWFSRWGGALTPTDDNGFVIGGLWNQRDNRFGGMRINARGEVLWDRIYSENDDSWCQDVIRQSGDIYYLVGWDPVQDAGDQGYIVKVNGNGDVIWQHHYGGEGNRFGHLYDIEAAEFGYILAGESGPRGENSSDFWVLRINEDGDELSSDLYGNDGFESARALVRSPDGGWAVAGFWASELPYWYGAILKLDENLREEWFQHYENEDHYTRLHDITTARGPGFIAVGDEGNHGGWSMGYCSRISAGGEIEWEIFEQPEQHYARFSSVHVDDTGLIIAVGNADVVPGNDRNHQGWVVGIRSPNEPPLVITKIPPDSIQRVPRGGNQAFIIEAEDPDGDELTYLWVLDEDTLGNDNMVILDFPELDTLNLTVSISDDEMTISTGWEITVFPLIVEWIPEDSLLQVDLNDTITFSVIAGLPEDSLVTYSWSYDQEIVSQADTLVQIFDVIGQHAVAVEVTGQEVTEMITWDVAVSEPFLVEDNSHLLTSNFLSRPTPNPFNSTTTMSYGLTSSGHIGLNVYDLSGHLVQKLFKGYQQAGLHTSTISAANLPSGSYVIRMVTSNQTDIANKTYNQKVTLIR